MQDRTLYARLLGIEDPWQVTNVTLRLDEEQAVVVSVAIDPGAALLCPQCRSCGSRCDSRERRWRHLDTMQYRTFLVADVPRVQCDEHGVVQIAVPWSDPKSRFRALFESARHRLAKGSQLLGGGPSALSELGSGGWDPRPGRSARADSEREAAAPSYRSR